MCRSVLFTVLVFVQISFATAQVPQIEREALIALYNNTSGDLWTTNTNWLGAVGTECTWWGVTCVDNHVQEISLYRNWLRGSLPPEMGNFPRLKDVWIGSNPLLTGDIPAELGNLANLEYLDLSFNELSGSIPPELGSLQNLIDLSLSQNQLSGSIPPVLGNVLTLESLSLSGNQLTGEIPPGLGNLVRLRGLNLAGNGLSGTIPAELGNLSNMFSFRLQSNRLTGSIPPELGNFSNVYNFWLSYNRLTGSIPPELGNLSTAEYFWLNDNQLTGSIPAELGGLSDVWWLDLSDNHLGGNIPSELGNIHGLRALLLGSNELTGNIPPELGDLVNLGTLTLDSNHLSGSIPPELGELNSLGALYLQDNRLTGSIPPNLGDLSSLDYLNLSFNQLSGGIPPELGELSDLNTLALSGNRLSGRMPSELVNLQDAHFGIGYNALWTDDPILQAFLDSTDYDWDETQTIAPDDLRVVSVKDHTVWLEWAPIIYTDDRGGYFAHNQWAPFGKGPGGVTLDKSTFSFPVTGLLPGDTYGFSLKTFTRPHAANQNQVVSDSTNPVVATTSNSGCSVPRVEVAGSSVPYTLTVTSTHDGFEWVTGETTASIMVRPHWGSWFWVKTVGPNSCEEAAMAYAPVLFYDGFEVDGWGFWSEVENPPPFPW